MTTKSTKFDYAVVDGDVLRYRCGFAVEYTLYHVEGLSEPLRGKKALNEYLSANQSIDTFAEPLIKEEKVVEPPENAIHIARQYLAQMEKVLKCPVKVILSGKTNFRDDIATIKPYKGNRPDHKPASFDAITTWFMDNGAIVTDGIEADDLMAIFAGQGDNVVICTVDKDLLQVPGWHYNFVNDELTHVTEDEGWYNLCVQIIAGDSTDNIQGIPKMGIKKAKKALEGCDTQNQMFSTVVLEYERYYGDEWEHFLDENAKLVYILRYPEDYWEKPPYEPEEEEDFGETW
jgi:hypothetical protein